MSVAWSIGMAVLVPLVLLLPAWRQVTLCTALLHGFLFVIGFFFWTLGVESPHWLAARGDAERFHAVLSCMLERMGAHISIGLLAPPTRYLLMCLSLQVPLLESLLPS